MKKLSAVLVAWLATSAQATEDFCAVVLKTPDGFLALREGPGTRFGVKANLRRGGPSTARWRVLARNWLQKSRRARRVRSNVIITDFGTRLPGIPECHLYLQAPLQSRGY
jgi:hypothetical protein